MSNNQENSDGAMKAFIVIMTVIALGLAGTLYYFSTGLTSDSKLHSLKATQARQPARVRMLQEIEEYLAPTVKNAFKVRDNVVSEASIARTKEKVREIITDFVGVEQLSGVNEPKESSANAREEFQQVSQQSDIKEITEDQAIDVIKEIVARTGKYATIANLTLKASRLKEADLEGAIDPNFFLWDLSFKLVWFQRNQKYIDAQNAGASN